MIPPALRLALVVPWMLGAPALAAPRPAGDRTPGDAQQSTARFHLDFDKVAITEVVRYIALWTGTNIVVPEHVQGNITIISPTPVTAEEAYDAFLAALDTAGLWLDREERPFQIRVKDGGPSTPHPVLPVHLNEDHITKVLRLRYADAEQMKSVLNPFIGHNGKLVAFPPDALIISDTALEVARVESFLEALDRPGGQVELHFVTLQHAAARDLAATLNQVFPGPAAGGSASSGARPRVLNVPGEDGEPGNLLPLVVTRIVADERTNRLIVIADGASFAKVERVIEQLDVE